MVEHDQKDRAYTLGISDSHDAGATLLLNGAIVAASNEERFSRQKMQAGFPHRAIQSVIASAGIQPRDIGRVAIAGTTRLGSVTQLNDFSDAFGNVSGGQKLAEALDRIPIVNRLMRTRMALGAYRTIMPLAHASRKQEMAAALGELGIETSIAADAQLYDHHACHAATAWLCSTTDECLILSNDGFGDGLSSLVAVLRGGRMDIIQQTSFFDSVGVFYNYATLLCGFPKAHHVGKTTGLAAFGDPSKTAPVFHELCIWDERLGRHVNRGPIFRNMVKLLRDRLAAHTREDIAAGAQAFVEDMLVRQAAHYMEITGIRDVAVAGGIHANVKVNQRIAALAGLRSLSVFPNMGDGGLATGAAWLGWVGAGAGQPSNVSHVYLGPEITEASAQVAIAASGLSAERPPSIAHAVAEALAQGLVVARASGAMEYGPRALGNRSILYGATDASVNSWLNARLQRTEFMPFAPVCRVENAPRHFVGVRDGTAQPARFMTITFDVNSDSALKYPAVTHVDQTARPQLIDRVINAEYWDILNHYEALTGNELLVNTSFNMHEEPIVCTAEEAIRAFQQSGIDCLALGPFLIRRPE